jgi:hypothetical protein
LVDGIEHLITVPNHNSYYDNEDYHEDMIIAAKKLGLDTDNIDDWYPPEYSDNFKPTQ